MWRQWKITKCQRWIRELRHGYFLLTWSICPLIQWHGGPSKFRTLMYALPRANAKEAAKPRATVSPTGSKREHGVQAVKSHSDSTHIPDGKIACYSADTVQVLVWLEYAREYLKDEDYKKKLRQIPRLKNISGIMYPIRDQTLARPSLETDWTAHVCIHSNVQSLSAAIGKVGTVTLR